MSFYHNRAADVLTAAAAAIAAVPALRPDALQQLQPSAFAIGCSSNGSRAACSAWSPARRLPGLIRNSCSLLFARRKKKIKPKWNANPSWMRERHVESVRKETPSKREGWKRNKSNQQIKQTRSWRRRCESCRFKVKGQLAGGGAKVCSSGCTASCCKTDHSELKRHQKILTFRAEQRGRASISAADTQIHSMLL